MRMILLMIALMLASSAARSDPPPQAGKPEWFRPAAPEAGPPIVITRPVIVSRPIVVVKRIVVLAHPKRQHQRRHRCAFLFFGCR